MPSEARRIVDAALGTVAPDLDASALGAHDELRSNVRLDSLDFLHLLTAVEHACGVAVPEADYAQVATYGALVDYVERRLGPQRGPG